MSEQKVDWQEQYAAVSRAYDQLSADASELRKKVALLEVHNIRAYNELESVKGQLQESKNMVSGYGAGWEEVSVELDETRNKLATLASAFKSLESDASDEGFAWVLDDVKNDGVTWDIVEQYTGGNVTPFPVDDDSFEGNVVVQALRSEGNEEAEDNRG